LEIQVAFWAYMLRCADGRYYTGHTDDLDRRIAEHQAGGHCDFTSRRRPLALVWCETFPSRLEALETKLRVKSWSRKKKEGLIAGNWQQVSLYARPPHERPSTSLGTNGGGGAPQESSDQTLAPFVSSEVETRRTHR